MKIILVIIEFGLLVACNSINSDKRFVAPKTEIVVKGVKYIEDTNFVVPKGVLLGKWRESLRWIKQDSTWIGVKCLNLIHEYEFFPSGKLINREIDIEHSLIAWTDILRGRLNDSRNILQVQKNQRNDTIFKPGELARRDARRIHLVNDSLLRIEEHFYTSSGKYELVIVDYKRVN